jgi:hypothetical protein
MEKLIKSTILCHFYDILQLISWIIKGNKKPAGDCLVHIKLAFYHKTSLPAELNNARKGIIFTFQN